MQKLSIFVADPNLASHHRYVPRILKLVVASTVALIVIIVFAHPATLVAPAPFSKHAPAFDLVSAMLSSLIVPLIACILVRFSNIFLPELIPDRSHRLALMCTLLC